MKHNKRGTGKSNLDIVQDYLDGNRPFTTVGYEGNLKKYREEGEIWTDSNGIQWKKENGKRIKLTKTQSDIIREAIGKL